MQNIQFFCNFRRMLLLPLRSTLTYFMSYFTLYFSKHEVLDYCDTMKYGYQICQYFGDRFQIVFGLHTDTDYVHLHFVLNTVSFVDGSKFSAGLADYLGLRNYIQSLMPQWKVELVSDS